MFVLVILDWRCSIESHGFSSKALAKSATDESSKITIPAVKITDAAPPTFPVLSSDDSLLPPDMCVSVPEKLEPMDQAMLEEAADAVLSATNHHECNEDIGEFLLDAVDWL